MTFGGDSVDVHSDNLAALVWTIYMEVAYQYTKPNVAGIFSS